MTFELQTLSEWCRANLPAQSRLLVHDAGFIACVTEFPLTDMVGLKTPASIRDHLELTWPSAGRRRAEAIQRIAVRSRADCLIVSQEWNHDFHIADGLQRLGWTVDALRRPRDYYQVYHLTPPREQGGPIAVRRRTPSLLACHGTGAAMIRRPGMR